VRACQEIHTARGGPTLELAQQNLFLPLWKVTSHACNPFPTL
jgi:hypothetical protein